MDVWIYAAAGLFLLAAGITDFKSMRIPNLLTLPFWAAGTFVHGCISGWHGLLWSVAGGAAGFIPLFVLYLFKGIGAGDVKMFGALGAWVGASAAAQVIMYSFLYGGVIGLVYMAVNRSFFWRMFPVLMSLVIPQSGIQILSAQRRGDGRSKAQFPFMLAVLPGAATVWFLL